MSKFGTLILGPAGAGKHSRRSSFYVNLDPAAEDFEYAPDLDIRDLITLEDVMEEMGLGPNGGLVHCFEFLLENLDFLSSALEPLTDEYLIIFDLPGQIELYTHIPLLPALIAHLGRMGPLNISLCAVYLLEATFVVDRAKFFAGALSAMSAMVLLELPHVNVMSKCDLVKGVVGNRELKAFVRGDVDEVMQGEATGVDDLPGASEEGAEEQRAEFPMDPGRKENVMNGASFKRLNRAVAGLIEEFGMVQFLKLEADEEDSVGAILAYVDEAIQFHEAQEPREPPEMEQDWDG
ncbi:MAG: hypothetical protein Q9160_003825 [Pyrenula sp. 1 TL-2023]